MKAGVIKLFWAFVVGASLATLGWAQEAKKDAVVEATQKTEATAQGKAEASTRPAEIKAGSKLEAELESSVDARSAKTGDEVMARLTKDVKENGHVVAHKGDRLVGRVTEVEADSSSHAGSRLGIAFDRLQRGETTTQLHTVVTSMFSAHNEGRGESEPREPEPLIAPPPSGSSGGASAGGGLLGGVGSSIRSTAGLAGSATGSAASELGATARGATSGLGDAGGAVNANSRTSAAGNAALGAATPMRAVHLSSSARADQQTGVDSVFSTKKGNLRLDSGTRLQFQVAAQTEAQQVKK